MNVQRKISIPAFLLYALKFITELPTPSNGRDTNITRGLPRMSTSLDILLTRPLRTLETRGAKYGHKTLNKTRRTSRPYASIAMVFLFTRKIILNAPASLASTSAFSRRVQRGSPTESPAKEKLSGGPSRSDSSDRHQDTKKQRIAILMQVTPNLVTNIRAQTHLVGAFSPLMLPS